MLDKKRIAFNVLGFVGVIIGLYFITWIYVEVNRAASINFNVLPVFLVQRIVPLLFGGAIRVPALLSRWQENRSFDWVRFVVQVIPGLFILVQPILSVIFSTPVLSMAFTQGIFSTFLGFWIGTVLIDCIKGSKITASESNIET